MTRRAVRAVAARAAEILSAAGLATLSWGVGMIYRPGGVIMAGMSLLVAGLAATR